MEDQTQKPKTNKYGIIALVIAIFSLFVPNFMLTVVMMAVATLMILGFINDRSKTYSFIALIVLVIILFSEFKDTAKGLSEYTIKYEVTCSDCDISYTNSTGGTDKVDNIIDSWQQEIKFKGDDFVYLSAQNGNTDSEVSVKIYVNNILFKEAKSNGKFSIANVSGKPKNSNSL